MTEIKLLKGDCLELMKRLPDKSIDMVLADLPYGTTRNKWDSIIDLDLLWIQYERVIKDNGVIALFAQTPFDKVLGCSNLKLLRYEWIWEKQQGTGHLNAKKMPLKKHENILIFYKQLPKYNPQFTKGKPYSITSGKGSTNYGEQSQVKTINEGVRYPVSVLSFKSDKDKLHPTQKPVGLLEYFINTYTDKSGVVLDNVMGSGSTDVACVNTDRKFIGMELNEEYFNIAEKRINESTKRSEIK